LASRILCVDDEPFNLDLLEEELGDQGYLVERATSGAQALRLIASTEPDLVLLDYVMPGVDGLDVLKKMCRDHPDVPVIMITAHGNVQRAVLAMKEGAVDFIAKPFDFEHMFLTIKRTLEGERTKRTVRMLSQELQSRHGHIIGTSSKLKEALDASQKAARFTSTVLLLGESGTGKELFARAIHNWSERKDQPFVVINCVGLSKELLESELFGHEKGAFTGAQQLKKGKMELAEGGTVFLDEVGDIAQDLQPKLLRFLQERQFERVGGTRTINADVRIVAATNRDLEQAVQDGTFREDLFFRLNVVPIVLPSLRERRQDIPELAEFFLRKFAAETKKHFTAIAPEALARLTSYDWPGNIRELINVIERAVVLGEGPEIVASDLPIKGRLQPVAKEENDVSFQEAVTEFKRELVIKTLDEVAGNRSAAARILKIQRNYFTRLIKALGIS